MFRPVPSGFDAGDLELGRAYLDFGRLDTLHSAGAFFVIRAKSNTKFRRRYSREVDKSTGVLCDQTVVLTGATSKDDYPQPLRRVKYRDAATGKTFDFLTNNFAIPAATVDAGLYTILQALSVTLFEKTPLSSVLSNEDDSATDTDDPNQLNLFDYLLGH